ncbi:hypothetical protein CBR_g21300 [Chara braunii]|uniref:BTB domain-containing protein n=1 Tax=Chara braunii TaxID=69332 RepID=A0A388L171_CHABU|nr:hypothetical protein CBR_g21300 [Chara braunii]|eukprot:GBG76060.1 hypothetical protein CBR_g21300 [Chara braunii]
MVMTATGVSDADGESTSFSPTMTSVSPTSTSVSPTSTTASTDSRGQQQLVVGRKTKNPGLETMEKRWNKIAGMQTDLLVTVNGTQFNVHKFPLYSKSDRLQEIAKDDPETGRTIADLGDLPGGDRVFVQVVNFCYGFDIDVSPYNVAALRCTAEVLHMHDESRSGMREGNLVPLSERALVNFFANWQDTVSILHHCQRLMPTASDCGLVDRCMTELCKFCLPSSAACATAAESSVPSRASLTSPRPSTPPVLGVHLRESVLSLELEFFAGLIAALRDAGMPAQDIGRSIDAYGRYWIPQIVGDDFLNIGKQRDIIETLVSLLPLREGDPGTIVDVFSKPAPVFRLLRAAVAYGADRNCQKQLVRMAGCMLHEADVDDLSNLEVHEVQAVSQVYFSLPTHNDDFSSAACKRVGRVIDEYLELTCSSISAAGSNPGTLSWETVQSLASAVPAEARASHNALFRALFLFLRLKKGAMAEKELVSLFEVVDPSKLSPELAEQATSHRALPPTFLARALVAQKEHMQSWIRELAEGTTLLLEERKRTDEEKLKISQEVEQLREEVRLADERLQQVRKNMREEALQVVKKHVVLKACVAELADQIQKLELERRILRERENGTREEGIQGRRQKKHYFFSCWWRQVRREDHNDNGTRQARSNDARPRNLALGDPPATGVGGGEGLSTTSSSHEQSAGESSEAGSGTRKAVRKAFKKLYHSDSSGSGDHIIAAAA